MRLHITILAVMVLLASICFSNSSFAQEKPREWTTVDLNQLDCRTFLKMTGDERGTALAFYHGVITGMKKEVIVNIPDLSDVSDKVLDHCIEKPESNLLKVFQEFRK